MTTDKFMTGLVCDWKENSGQNRNRNWIAIIRPKMDEHPTKLAGFCRIDQILNQI